MLITREKWVKATLKIIFMQALQLIQNRDYIRPPAIKVTFSRYPKNTRKQPRKSPFGTGVTYMRTTQL
jgi:hypothetical protein